MTQELIDAATAAVDEQQLERAQALALIAQAAALDSMAESLARIADVMEANDDRDGLAESVAIWGSGK